MRASPFEMCSQVSSVIVMVVYFVMARDSVSPLYSVWVHFLFFAYFFHWSRLANIFKNSTWCNFWISKSKDQKKNL